jgi:hypothetical protein
MEQWKSIENFENYEISNFGNVRNRVSNKILKLNKKSGYYYINLTKNKIKKSFIVHRLVALAFIENPENKSDVNHKDKNKLNNHITNLEWNTRKENNLHRSRGIIIKTNKNKSLFRINTETKEKIEKYESIEQAGFWALNNDLTKTSHNGRNAIGNCLNGLTKTAYEFYWEYENKNEDLENEIWKQIFIENNSDSDKKYFVSNLGRFKNSFGIIMDDYKVNDRGYIRVYIYNKTYYLHRIIAEIFIENPEKKEQVNHKDGNKVNNSIKNLEWVTNQENQIHKFQNGLGNNFTRAIVQYDLQMNQINHYHSISEASRLLNIGKTNIQGVLINRRKTAGGFIFKYLE